MLIYHKLEKKPEEKLQDIFEQHVMEKLQEHYDRVLLEEDEKGLKAKKLKEFTAIVLLKLKHQFFLFNSYHKDQIQYFSESAVRPSKTLTVKIYHEMMDNLTDMISQCVDENNLKHCVYYQIKKIFTFLSNKYQLKSSYTGIHLYYYLQKFFQFLMKDMKTEDFQDIGLLKKYYYPRLFKSLFNFKIRFRIKDDQSLEKLEKSLGKLIDLYKLNIDGDLKNIKFRVLD